MDLSILAIVLSAIVVILAGLNIYLGIKNGKLSDPAGVEQIKGVIYQAIEDVFKIYGDRESQDNLIKDAIDLAKVELDSLPNISQADKDFWTKEKIAVIVGEIVRLFPKAPVPPVAPVPDAPVQEPAPPVQEAPAALEAQPEAPVQQ